MVSVIQKYSNFTHANTIHEIDDRIVKELIVIGNNSKPVSFFSVEPVKKMSLAWLLVVLSCDQTFLSMYERENLATIIVFVIPLFILFTNVFKNLCTNFHRSPGLGLVTSPLAVHVGQAEVAGYTPSG